MFLSTEKISEVVSQFCSSRVLDPRIEQYLKNTYVHHLSQIPAHRVPVVVACTDATSDSRRFNACRPWTWASMSEAMKQAFINDEGVWEVSIQAVGISTLQHMVRGLRQLLKAKPDVPTLAGHLPKNVNAGAISYRDSVMQRWKENRAKHGLHHVYDAGERQLFLVSNNAALEIVGKALRNCMRNAFTTQANTLGSKTFIGVYYMAISHNGKWTSMATIPTSRMPTLDEKTLKSRILNGIRSHLGIENQHASETDQVVMRTGMSYGWDKLYAALGKSLVAHSGVPTKSSLQRGDTGWLAQSGSIFRTERPTDLVTAGDLMIRREFPDAGTVRFLDTGDLTIPMEMNFEQIESRLFRQGGIGRGEMVALDRFARALTPNAALPSRSVRSAAFGMLYGMNVIMDEYHEFATVNPYLKPEVPRADVQNRNRSQTDLVRRTLQRSKAKRSVPKWLQPKESNQ